MCGVEWAKIKAKSDKVLIREGRRAGLILGEPTEKEVEVLRTHYEAKRQAAIREIRAQRAALLEVEEKRKHITELLVSEGVLDHSALDTPGGVNEGLAEKERRRMAQVRAKQEEEMEAAMEAEMKASEMIAKIAAQTAAEEKKERARRKAIREERQKAMEKRKREADAKAAKERAAAEAAERQQKKWYAAELERIAKKEEEHKKARKRKAKEEKKKREQMAELERQREEEAKREVLESQRKAALAEERQKELLRKLEEKRAMQREEIARKAEIARQRVAAAVEADKLRQKEDRERFLSQMAKAEKKRKEWEAERKVELEIKARERAMKEKEVQGRVDRTRLDIERWRDGLAKKEESRSHFIDTVRAERAEAAKPRFLELRLRQMAKIESVQRQKQRHKARQEGLREALVKEQAAAKRFEAEKEVLRKQVEQNARRMLIEKHALQDETDRLRITGKSSLLESKKKKMALEAEAADDD